MIIERIEGERTTEQMAGSGERLVIVDARVGRQSAGGGCGMGSKRDCVEWDVSGSVSTRESWAESACVCVY